jgi:hypothetical protein
VQSALALRSYAQRTSSTTRQRQRSPSGFFRKPRHDIAKSVGSNVSLEHEYEEAAALLDAIARRTEVTVVPSWLASPQPVISNQTGHAGRMHSDQ